MTSLYDIAIVGYGPSGAFAAARLGQAGLKVFVCDRQHAVYDKPRAIALDHEILRQFDQLGLLDEITPYTEPFTDSEYYGVNGQLIKRMTTVAPPYPLAHSPSVVFTQPPVERALRARVAQLKNVDVALGAELVDLMQDDAAARLVLRIEDGSERRISARYVIGCDGASSRVRGLAELPLIDLGFDEPWLVVDVLVNERGLAKLPKVSVQYCEPDRPCTFVIGPGLHRRWEISLKEGEDPAQAATPEGVWPLLQRWITPDDGQLWRQASYRFHALVAERWRNGRIFIAGDAAHQQPPFLGQGLCQGIRDVCNLSWKLLAVLQQGAHERLLDSYGEERRQHVTELTGRIKSIGAVICERDPLKARARDAALLAECAGQVRGTPRQDVQPTLRSALPATPLHPANGSLFPQPWILGDVAPERLDTLSGCGWRVVLNVGFDCDPASVPASIIERLQARVLRLSRGPEDRSEHQTFQEADGVLAAWFERHACGAALVRPDHYVHGVASSAQALQAQLQALAEFMGDVDQTHSDARQTAQALI